jgi:hypothetical protein
MTSGHCLGAFKPGHLSVSPTKYGASHILPLPFLFSLSPSPSPTSSFKGLSTLDEKYYQSSSVNFLGEIQMSSSSDRSLLVLKLEHMNTVEATVVMYESIQIAIYIPSIILSLLRKCCRPLAGYPTK